MFSFLELYNSTAADLERYSAPLLNGNRAVAAQWLTRNGMPTRHTEGYRQIDLSAAFDIDYGVNVRRLQLPQSGQAMHCDVRGINPILCWVINGEIHVPEQLAEKGVIITTLSKNAMTEPFLPNAEFKDPLVALNAMFAQDGLLINIPDGVRLEQPIQIMNISNAALDLMTAVHNIVIIGRNAKAQVLVCDHADPRQHYLCSSTTEVFVGEHASYEHYHLEDTTAGMCRLNNLIIRQSAVSEVLVNMITLRNGLTRNNVFIDQTGADCRTNLCGMFVGSGSQVTDNFTKINHFSTGGHSNELFKYVLDDHSRGIFKGELIVAKGAQKTEAYQTNRNILLTREATVRTEPQLEIYADDVKCSHGATTGQLDENALFYMRQRGIPEAEARLLLMNAFVADVINNIRIEVLQDRIRSLTDSRLRNSDDSPCLTCHACKQTDK